MKRMEICNFVFFPREFAVEGLERAYQELKESPPKAIAFSDNDGNQLFLWEDVEILHFIPTRDIKLKYYWILHTRDKVLNGESSASSASEVIKYYLS